MKLLIMILTILSLSFSSIAEELEGAKTSDYNADLCQLLEAALPISLQLQKSAEFENQRSKAILEKSLQGISRDLIVLTVRNNKHMNAYLDILKAEELASELENNEAIIVGIEQQKNLLLQKINRSDDASKIAMLFMLEDSAIEDDEHDLYHIEFEYMGEEIDKSNTEGNKMPFKIPYIVELSYRSKKNPDHFVDISIDLFNGKLINFEELNGEIIPMEDVEEAMEAKRVACKDATREELELEKLGRTGTDDKGGIAKALVSLGQSFEASKQGGDPTTKDVE